MISNFKLKFSMAALFLIIAGGALITKDMTLGLDLEGGSSIRYTVRDDFIERNIPPDEWGAQVEQTIAIIQQRIDSLGLKEIPISPQGNSELVVELPGMTSSEAAAIEDLISAQGRLEFRLAGYEGPEVGGLNTGDQKRLNEAMVAFWESIPEEEREEKGRNIDVRSVTADFPGWRFYPYSEAYERSRLGDEAFDAATGAINWQLVKVDDKYNVTGDDIADVHKAQDRNGNPCVGFDIKPGRTQKMGALTGDNEGREMCVVLDGQIHSKAVIQSRITDSGIITGGTFGFKAEELTNLLVVMRSGSLPVKPIKMSRSDIGPTLGQASISRGVTASQIGILLVVIFIAIYYMRAGMIACVTLAANLVLLVGALKFLEATLTLPGIAGIILTVGMAVDANILIFERIREEIDRDKSLYQSVKTGFEKAFFTIFDANVTTLFTGFILFKFGSGPIKGFAVTLMLGILTSMFSALIISKIIFSMGVEKGWFKTLKMKRLISKTTIPFMSMVGKTRILSVVGMVLGIAIFFALGPQKYGLDFLGGYKAKVVLNTEKSQPEIEKLIKVEFADAEVVTVGGGGDTSAEFQIKIKKLGEDEATEDQDTSNASLFPFFAAAPQDDNPSGDDSAAPPPSDGAEGEQADEQPEDEEARYVEGIRRALSELLLADGLADLTLSDDEINNVTKATFTATFIGSPSPDLITRSLEAQGFSQATVSPVAGREGAFNVSGNFQTIMAESTASARLLDALTSLPETRLSEPFLEKAFIGSRVGGELRDNAIKAIVVSFIVIIIYIRVRFRGYRYGIAACVALAHDVVISLGAVSLARATGLVDIEIDLALIAAFLTIIGYSLNDTIVVFDRIRENLPRVDRPLREVVNLSINQTLARTLLTSITTMLVVFTIFLLNYGQGNVLESFSFTMIIGIIVGTYSSIFVASPVMVWIAENEEKKKAAAAAA